MPTKKGFTVANQTVRFASSESLAQIADSTVDLVVTSPPYWNLKRYGNANGQLGNEPYDRYIERLNTVWQECYRVCKETSILVINVNSRRHKGQFYPIAFDIYKAMSGWKLWDMLIWYIPNALPQPNSYMERLFDNKFEYVMIFLKGDWRSYTFHKPRVPQKYLIADPRDHKRNADGRCLGNIVRIPAYRPPNVKKLGYHEAAFPEELVALMIESFSNPGDVVLDPFLGSGTTLKVARVTERNGIGYEVNREYEDLIRANILTHWEVPDWKKVDLIHSSTQKTGMDAPRKIHFQKMGFSEGLA